MIVLHSGRVKSDPGMFFCVKNDGAQKFGQVPLLFCTTLSQWICAPHSEKICPSKTIFSFVSLLVFVQNFLRSMQKFQWWEWSWKPIPSLHVGHDSLNKKKFWILRASVIWNFQLSGEKISSHAHSLPFKKWACRNSKINDTKHPKTSSNHGH